MAPRNETETTGAVWQKVLATIAAISCFVEWPPGTRPPVEVVEVPVDKIDEDDDLLSLVDRLLEKKLRQRRASTNLHVGVSLALAILSLLVALGSVGYLFFHPLTPDRPSVVVHTSEAAVWAEPMNSTAIATAVPPSNASHFELAWEPSDPALPTMEFPGCAVYCQIIQAACSCPPNVLTVGNVTTVASGGNATVVLAGTSPSQVISFGLPQGIQGFQGFPGKTLMFGLGNHGSFFLNGASSGNTAVISGSGHFYTLLQDLYAYNLTLGVNVSLCACGFKVMVYDTLYMYNQSVIHNNGGTGAAGAATTGTNPVPCSGGTLGCGGAGGAPVKNANGNAGAAVTFSIAPGTGGSGNSATPRTAGAGGTGTAPTAAEGGPYVFFSAAGAVSGRSLSTNTLLLGGAGGGSGASSTGAAASGGGGNGGGVVFVGAYYIVMDANCTVAYVQANGGNGGTAFSTTAVEGGGGVGGGILVQTESIWATFMGVLTVQSDGGLAGGPGATAGPAGVWMVDAN